MSRPPLGPPAFDVPANASRFFSSSEEAQQQSTGRIDLSFHEKYGFLFNTAFDPTLIAHDAAYCTSVVDLNLQVQLPTLDYFESRVLAVIGAGSRVLDVGCGQGEFVRALRSRGVDAVGFDPVLRAPSEFLTAEYWAPGLLSADLFVMRCVLPHIPDPWDFLLRIAERHPTSLVLVEFQRLEWILERAIWYQISHDHVNLFSIADFTAWFDVVDSGTFGNGEWGWVLVRPEMQASQFSPSVPHRQRLLDLLDERARLMAQAQQLGPVGLWGAAGKGIVLAHALVSAGGRVEVAVDADPHRQGRYMDVTGVPIISPEDAAVAVDNRTPLLVCNPNHLLAIREKFGDRWDLMTVRDLSMNAS